MKKIFNILILLTAVVFAACEKDNYDEPDVTLSGAITYEGDTLRVKSGEVTLQLFEMGWNASASSYVSVHVDQDGTFTQKIFSGKTYKLICSDTGPWNLPATSDTITLQTAGDIRQNVEVRPYFLLKNTQISTAVIGEEQLVKAVFNINKVDADAEVEFATLYINENYIIDAQRTNQTKSLTAVSFSSENEIEMELNETMKKYNFVYARIGLKIRNVSSLLYSDIVKIDIQK